ncbi:MAG: hypothetical protein CMJ89_03370 [Planctomycetes bacterium]|nr:hypothetical protein [Planctomycetota bacterium]
MVALEDAIHAFLREKRVRVTSAYTRVADAWSKNLNAVERAHATPVKFFRGTLTVEVESGVFLHELKNIKNEKYRQQANQDLGQESIRKVSFRLKG